MPSLSQLPALNAALNGTSALLLVAGFWFIRRKNVTAHRVCMSGAFVVSTLFLISYLYLHYHAGSTRFDGTGWTRQLYFSILISHSILAAAVVPLVLTTLYRALRGQFDKHRRIARWTLPAWLYVSVTGVLIYFMLYHWLRTH